MLAHSLLGPMSCGGRHGAILWYYVPSGPSYLESRLRCLCAWLSRRLRRSSTFGRNDPL
jgi:hypothetical protein